MAAAPAEPNGASIEALFRPVTRWRDSHQNRRGSLPEGCTEVELLPGLTIENIRATRLPWNSFHRFLRKKIVWMTSGVFVCNAYLHNRGDPLVLFLGCDASNTRLCAHVTRGTAAAVATATCDFLVCLLATCEERDLRILGYDNPLAPLSGAALSIFFQESRDSLQKVNLRDITLSEDQCLALATMSRLDVELKVDWCSLADDAAGAFVEFLQSDRGPVEMNWCRIDSQIIANALTGDSRVTSFKPASGLTDDAEAVFFRALANNRSLVNLDLRNHYISNENWTFMCQSLQAHPTLTSLFLLRTLPRSPAGAAIIFSDEQRTRALAEMMQTNTVLQTIELLASERNNQIYTKEIRPYLVTNLYRPRVHKIKKTKDRPFREKLLGRALHSVRRNPNLVWMLLSENVDAFVRSEEEEEESNSEVPVAVAAAVVLAVAGSKRKR
jgi:hypothetical protein